MEHAGALAVSDAENRHILVSKLLQYFGAMASVLGGLTISEIGVIVGIVIGVAGFVAAQYWQWRQTRIAAAVARAQIEALHAGTDTSHVD